MPQSPANSRPIPDRFEEPEFGILIEKNADAIVLIDEDGTVLFANPAAEQMFGRSFSDLVGSPIGIPMTGGETTEITLLRPRRGAIEAEMRVVSTTWRGRDVLLASLRDITSRRIEQERLRQAQKMEVVGQLTAGVAHDFNNILTVATGNLELLRRDLRHGRDSKRIDATLSALARAERLTAQLLAFARKQRLDPEVVDINSVLVGLEELLRRAIGSHIEMRYRLANGLPAALIDRNHLETALLNIAANARDAMPNGGQFVVETTVRVLDRARFAEDAVVEPGRYVEILARDTGEGMSAAVLQRAFEPFFSTKEPGRGTGLGLAMVYGFVRQSGGHVELQSAPGHGTRIALYLPCAPADYSPRENREVAESVAPGHETILVVEDDLSVRALACSMLRDLGYTVIEAASGPAALDVLAAQPAVDLVFSDIVMPGRPNGLELARMLLTQRPDLPVVLTSGYNSRYDDPGETLPLVEFIHKPYHQAALSVRLRTALQKRSSNATSRHP
ncbi:MAG TPA: ATP-binding protein [Stellaceae bacterium]|nr:ATP-binding protein [Stellaceae bacterium]